MQKRLPTVIGLCLGLAASGGLAGSVAAEEGVAVKNILGNIGLIPKEKDPIRYRERAPLVLPPKTALPSPTNSASDRYAAGASDWPLDPDVAERRRRSEDDRRPVTWSETRRMSERNPLLTQQELQAGRAAGAQGADPRTHRGDSARDLLYANPDGARQVENAVPTINGEPQRQALTDPPTGLRKSAQGKKTVSADYGPRIDQQTRDANPINWLTERFNKSDDD